MDIFVGSIPFKMKEEEVRELFEKYGEVASVKLIKDKVIKTVSAFTAKEVEFLKGEIFNQSL